MCCPLVARMFHAFCVVCVCGALWQDEDEDVTFSTVWDVATYTGQTRSLLHNIASIYPAVRGALLQ